MTPVNFSSEIAILLESVLNEVPWRERVFGRVESKISNQLAENQANLGLCSDHAPAPANPHNNKNITQIDRIDRYIQWDSRISNWTVPLQYSRASMTKSWTFIVLKRHRWVQIERTMRSSIITPTTKYPKSALTLVPNSIWTFLVCVV